MKKIIISLLLISIFTTSINADTYTGTSSISLSYSYLPSYSVKIPKKLNISNNATTFNYYVSGDIYFDSYLQVLFDKETTIYCGDKNAIVYIHQDKTLWSQDELSSSYQEYSAYISHDTLSSGLWHGELNMVISLVGGV